MQHLINATNKVIELENGQRIFPGQSYAKEEEEAEKPVKKGKNKKDDASNESTDAK